MPEARFEPIMNSKYKVRSSWGEVLECVIMRKRHRYGTKVHEYFVHYLEVPDRCVDEWILVENILIDEADEGAPGMGRLRRRTRRNYSEDVEIDETQSSRTTSCAAEKQAEEARPSEFTSQTMVKMIINVYFYEYLMSTWYYSPYPSAYEKGFPLLVCHVCFRYFKCKRKYTEHVYKNKCSLHLQLGSVVYENEQLQIRKTTVLSRRERKMCQCMLLLAKLFIDCKKKIEANSSLCELL